MENLCTFGLICGKTFAYITGCPILVLLRRKLMWQYMIPCSRNFWRTYFIYPCPNKLMRNFYSLKLFVKQQDKWLLKELWIHGHIFGVMQNFHQRRPTTPWLGPNLLCHTLDGFGNLHANPSTSSFSGCWYMTGLTQGTFYQERILSFKLIIVPCCNAPGKKHSFICFGHAHLQKDVGTLCALADYEVFQFMKLFQI